MQNQKKIRTAVKLTAALIAVFAFLVIRNFMTVDFTPQESLFPSVAFDSHYDSSAIVGGQSTGLLRYAYTTNEKVWYRGENTERIWEIFSQFAAAVNEIEIKAAILTNREAYEITGGSGEVKTYIQLHAIKSAYRKNVEKEIAKIKRVLGNRVSYEAFMRFEKVFKELEKSLKRSVSGMGTHFTCQWRSKCHHYYRGADFSTRFQSYGESYESFFETLSMEDFAKIAKPMDPLHKVTNPYIALREAINDLVEDAGGIKSPGGATISYLTSMENYEYDTKRRTPPKFTPLIALTESLCRCE